MKKIVTLPLLLLFVPLLIALMVWMKIPTENEIKGCLTTKMYQVELCPKSPHYVALRNISPYMIKTVVLTEDSLFWEHKGFDWEAIKKNYQENAKAGFYKRGGSTITQQLAKNMFLSADKNLIRKGLEALITIKIEKVLKKKEILERYLNVVEFGKDLYGVKDAAQTYFHKSPADLDIVESAFLAMLLPNPKKYAASFYKKELTPFAAKRIHQIVDNMYQYHRIDDQEYQGALARLENFFGMKVEMPPDSDFIDEEMTLESLEKALPEEEQE